MSKNSNSDGTSRPNEGVNWFRFSKRLNLVMALFLFIPALVASISVVAPSANAATPNTFAAPKKVAPHLSWSNPTNIIGASVEPFVAVSRAPINNGAVAVVASSYTGNPYLTYADSAHGYNQIRFSVSSAGIAGNYPKGTYDASGNFHLVYSDRGGDGYFHTYYIRFAPDDSHTNPVDISSQVGLSNALYPTIAATSDGKILYVGSEQNRSTVGIYSSSDGGNTWGNNIVPSGIVVAEAGSSYPWVTVDIDNNPHLTFVGSNSASTGTKDVYAFDRTSDGNYKTTLIDVLGTSGNRAFWTAIASAPNGDMQAVWTEDLTSGVTTNKQISTIHWTHATRTWSNEIQNVSQSNPSLGGNGAAVTIDPNGNIYIGYWTQTGGSGGAIVVSVNNGQSFGAPTQIINNSYQRGGRQMGLATSGPAANGVGYVYFVEQLDDGSVTFNSYLSVAQISVPTSGGPTPTPTPNCATAAPLTTTNFTAPAQGNFTYNLPYLANNYAPTSSSCFTTYTALQNLGTQPANISFYYYDQNGSSVPVPAGTCNSVPVFGECTPPNAFANGNYGSGVIVSSQPLNIIISESTSLGGGAYPVSGTTANQLVAPFAINNALGGFVTQMTVYNPSSSVINVTVNFYDQNGNAQSNATQNFFLRPYTAKIIDQSASGSNLASGFYGWATVNGNGSPVVAQVLEQNPNNHFVAIANALPLNSQAATNGTTVYAPGIYNGAFGGYITGANFINPTSTTATVNITYYDASGNATSVPAFTINPNSIVSVYSAAAAGSTGLPTGGLPAGFDGAAKITSNAAIVMTVNEKFPSGGGTYSAAPNSKGTVNLPAVANGGLGGFVSGLTILNTSSQAVTGSIQYYDVNGNSAGNSQTFTIPANASQQYYQGTGGNSGLPSNFYGSATVTESGGGSSLIVTTNVLNSNSNLFYTYTEPTL